MSGRTPICANSAGSASSAGSVSSGARRHRHPHAHGHTHTATHKTDNTRGILLPKRIVLYFWEGPRDHNVSLGGHDHAREGQFCGHRRLLSTFGKVKKNCCWERDCSPHGGGGGEGRGWWWWWCGRGSLTESLCRLTVTGCTELRRQNTWESDSRQSPPPPSPRQRRTLRHRGLRKLALNSGTTQSSAKNGLPKAKKTLHRGHNPPKRPVSVANWNVHKLWR